MLAALLLDVPERAMELLDAAALDDGLRARLRSAVQDAATPAGRAEALGDQLRARGRWLDPDVIECYRAAFYIGDDWEAQLDNPLFARFAAKRAGCPSTSGRTTSTSTGARSRPTSARRPGCSRSACSTVAAWTSSSALLGPQAVLVGMDVDPSAEAACAGRFDVAVGDQSDPEFLTSVVERFGPFDVIIDDGGHTMAQQITSVECLFPTLNDGGVYLVEDTHTSYWEPFQDADQTFMEWAKARLDDINGYHFSTDAELGVWTTSVTGIHVYDSVVVLDKGRHQPPFCEVAGSGSFVYADRISESALLSHRASLDTRTMQLRQAQDFAAAALTDRQEAVDFGSQPTTCAPACPTRWRSCAPNLPPNGSEPPRSARSSLPRPAWPKPSASAHSWPKRSPRSSWPTRSRRSTLPRRREGPAASALVADVSRSAHGPTTNVHNRWLSG